MSSLTRADIGVIARRRAGAPVSDRPRFEALVDDALKSLAHKVARRDDWREFRREINVTASSGVITPADDSVLFGLLHETGVLVLNGVTAKWRRYEELTLKFPRDTYWAAVRNRKIYVADFPAGALGAVNQSGTLECNCTLTLSQLPPAYDKELIGEVVLLSAGGKG